MHTGIPGKVGFFSKADFELLEVRYIKQIQPRVFQLYGANSFNFARIELKFGSHDRWVIFWAWLMVQNAKFIISRFLVVIFLEIQMLRLANLQNK